MIQCIVVLCRGTEKNKIIFPFLLQDLEDALIIDGSSEEEGSRFLADLHARLLRGLFLTKDIE